MIEVTIDSVRQSLMNYQRVVMLKEKDGRTYLPIWIGSAEGQAIVYGVRQEKAQRPLTHDLMKSIIEKLGATIQHVEVSDLIKDTFYGKIILNVDNEKIEIDSRTSDAIALAAKAGVPIYVEETVMERAGITLDDETGKPIPREAEEKGIKATLSEEDLRNLGAFTDFIDTLDMEDFNKRSS